MTTGQLFLESVTKRFLTYKTLGEKTFEQLSDEQLCWEPPGYPNSIYVIVKHVSGNMCSRFTDFLTTDGEKPGRQRDEEFKPGIASRAEIIGLWDKGWDVLLNTLRSLTDEDLAKTVTIRGEPHSVIDAINRQLGHYPYHVGQIVYLGKIMQQENWRSLSIPVGQSEQFNKEKFGR
ncbi:DUF1572 domain-containing protein [Chitinophaga horti]|uniref:DUF1572 domain-containing protein n=1 Tax=Chitinophaga horti TaxID=2920382 RepID=A0ABY6IXF8_9BACT|nr:DUF1572 domain-containing protein [Chitinophaga horti]UYQ91087.1 DUF1572 domain-containing protein [Chitinophaga horti]